MKKRAQAEAEGLPQEGIPVTQRTVSPEAVRDMRRGASTPTRAADTAPRRADLPPRQETAPTAGGGVQGEPGKVIRVRHAPERKPEPVQAPPALRYVDLTKRRRHWLPIVVTVLVVLVLLSGVSLLLLFNTATGLRQLARWGYDVSASAYIDLGHEYLDNGYIVKAVAAYKVAYEKEPDNIEAALELASAYEINGERPAAEEIYWHLIDELAPQHTEAYNRMIRIYRDDGYTAEAVELMRKALEKTGSSTFESMIGEYTPTTPEFSVDGGKYNEKQVVAITSNAESQIYYTLDAEMDPLETGELLLEGEVLVFDEDDTRLCDRAENGVLTQKRVFDTTGKVTVRAVAISATGVPSAEAKESYQVVIPTPNAPKSNVAPGTYTSSRKVTLRADKDIVEIHYTLDGTTPTLESTLYTEPIQLPTGTTTLRSIALSSNGKISYEMSVTYKIEGNLKKMFNSDDTFKDLKIMSTNYDAFVKKYGAPDNYVAIDGDGTGASYEGTWSWGIARFVEKTEGKKPVLYYLETTTNTMTAPRKTKVGMSGKEVMGQFRDIGSYPKENGERLLYNYSDSTVKLNTQIGTYRLEEDGNFALHYYYPTKDKAFVELSYYLNANGDVARIVWTRYRSEA